MYKLIFGFFKIDTHHFDLADHQRPFMITDGLSNLIIGQSYFLWEEIPNILRIKNKEGQMGKATVMIGVFDIKEFQYAFLRDQIFARGHAVITGNTGGVQRTDEKIQGDSVQKVAYV